VGSRKRPNNRRPVISLRSVYFDFSAGDVSIAEEGHRQHQHHADVELGQEHDVQLPTAQPELVSGAPIFIRPSAVSVMGE
jgi:hypothetical protein